VAAGLKRLTGQTGMLAGDVQRGNLAAARRDWLPAHLTYATLGAAYASFGKFDDKIDGRADALGVHNPKWTGFCQRIPGSFDATSGSLDAPGGLLNFHAKPHDTPLILNPKTGAVVSGG
jgi:high-affinity iron transporter